MSVVTEEPQLPAGESLVYLRRGQVAHRARSSESHDTVCKIVDRTELLRKDFELFVELYGTGTQDEWEKARSLPLCRTCFPDGPRRPAVAS